MADQTPIKKDQLNGDKESTKDEKESKMEDGSPNKISRSASRSQSKSKSNRSRSKSNSSERRSRSRSNSRDKDK